MSVRLRPQARTDILDLVEQIGETYPAAGRAFLRRVNETLDFLERFPKLGGELPDPAVAHSALRVFPVRRFREYLIVFLPADDGVEVVRVINGRRDLGGLFEDFG